MITAFLLIFGLLWLGLSFFLTLTILIGLDTRKEIKKSETALSPDIMAVLIPAHNEAEGIKATIKAIQSQLSPWDRMVIIADNCTDDTAAIAQQLGCEAVERQDTELRGKGHALAAGMDYLTRNPPEMVLIMDADCIPKEGAIGQLRAALYETEAPVQSAYIMTIPEGAESPYLRLRAFAFRLRNSIRVLGLTVLGGACPLLGTGMGFPYTLARDLPFESGSLAEDTELGLHLARAGHGAHFVPSAVVKSYFSSSESASQIQEKRWIHGSMAERIAQSGPLFKASFKRRDWHALLLAIDTIIPPLGLWLGLSFFWFIISGGAWPFTAALAIMLGTLMVAWWVAGRDLVSIRDLALTPLFILKRIGLALTSLFKRETIWQRTPRGKEPTTPDPQK